MIALQLLIQQCRNKKTKSHTNIAKSRSCIGWRKILSSINLASDNITLQVCCGEGEAMTSSVNKMLSWLAGLSLSLSELAKRMDFFFHRNYKRRQCKRGLQISVPIPIPSASSAAAAAAASSTGQTDGQFAQCRKPVLLYSSLCTCIKQYTVIHNQPVWCKRVIIALCHRFARELFLCRFKGSIVLWQQPA